MSKTFAELMKTVHNDNMRWWQDKDGNMKERNVGEMLMLVTSELAEAMEGHRKNLSDDKLGHRPMFEVEIADAMIRLLDISAHLCPDIETIIEEKLAFNRQREDHKWDHRLAAGGKKY